MREVARTRRSELHPLGVRGQRVIDLHQQLAGLLRVRLGPSHAGFFAEPVTGRSGDEIVWYSDAPGAIVKLGEAVDEARTAGESRLGALIGEIEVLIEDLAGSGDPAGEFNAESLRQALVCPENSIYLVGDQPVVVNWGCRLEASEQAPVELIRMGRRPPPARVPQTRVPPQPAVVATGPVVVTAVAARRGVPDWIGRLLLSIVLAVLLVFLLRACQPELLGVAEEPPDDGGIEALADARAEEARLRAEIEDLTRKFHGALAQCQVPEPEKVVEIPEPEAQPGPEEPIEKVPEEEEIAEEPELPACPGERPKEEAPKLVVMLDVSISMDFPADIDPNLYERVWRAANRGNLMERIGAMSQLARLDQRSRINRNQVAKPALVEVIRSIPEDVDIGLVLAGECEAVTVGYFAAPDRPSLIQKIQSIGTYPSTPLADGLIKAGRLMEQGGGEGLILVVSDGVDSCGGDPCAAVQRLAQRLPDVKVNVLDVFGTGERSCLAAPSGGQVFTPTDVNDVADLIKQATQAVALPEHCKAQ